MAASIAADLLRESRAAHLELEGIAGYQAVIEHLVRRLTEEASEDLRVWLE